MIGITQSRRRMEHLKFSRTWKQAKNLICPAPRSQTLSTICKRCAQWLQMVPSSRFVIVVWVIPTQSISSTYFWMNWENWHLKKRYEELINSCFNILFKLNSFSMPFRCRIVISTTSEKLILTSMLLHVWIKNTCYVSSRRHWSRMLMKLSLLLRMGKWLLLKFSNLWIWLHTIWRLTCWWVGSQWFSSLKRAVVW